MPPYTITLDLPEHLYHSARTVAQATQQPLATILQDSLTHTLPPLDDVPAAEATALAQMSGLDDAALWQASRVALSASAQATLDTLLEHQSAGPLTPDEARQLQGLLDAYGALLVHSRTPRVWRAPTGAAGCRSAPDPRWEDFTTRRSARVEAWRRSNCLGGCQRLR